ncbi:hypothetical protein CL614_07265 [archaeon]|nr:hypothetical protein [archaeon]|tara:strand:+ start:4309 stop:5103 length:795 start_codon:yes stop_codon:yes gene_type:complete
MKLRGYYRAVRIKNSEKYKLSFEKTKNRRPAWIKVEGLPKRTSFISVFLDKKGKQGKRIQLYKKYLTFSGNLYLPINWTKEEMKKYYDKWAKDYDHGLKFTAKGQNIKAAEFLIKKLKKHIKGGEVLDLGAGSGIITEMFVKAGFGPVTLVDYSEGMLKQAKKRKGLQGCKFIKKDVRKLNLKKKFDLVMSFFSFGSSSYFDDEELDKILEIPHKHLKKGGVFALLGHVPVKKFEKKFKKLDSGIYELNKKKKFYTDYFIGRKK